MAVVGLDWSDGLCSYWDRLRRDTIRLDGARVDPGYPSCVGRNGGRGRGRGVWRSCCTLRIGRRGEIRGFDGSLMERAFHSMGMMERSREQ